jgi:hypothetical protein
MYRVNSFKLVELSSITKIIVWFSYWPTVLDSGPTVLDSGPPARSLAECMNMFAVNSFLHLFSIVCSDC